MTYLVLSLSLTSCSGTTWVPTMRSGHMIFFRWIPKSTSKSYHAAYDRYTSNIFPTLSMGWILPPWLNSTFGGQRYRLQGAFFVSSIFSLISVEILVTVVVWVLVARTPPTFIVRPAVDQNLGDHSYGPQAVGSAIPCHFYIYYTAWRFGWMLYESGTAILMEVLSCECVNLILNLRGV